MTNGIVSTYTTYVVSISNMRAVYISELDYLSKTYLLKSDQFEYLFDWMLQQAFLDLMPNNTYGLQQHYKHDLFEQIYETYYKYRLPVSIAARLRDLSVDHPSTHNSIYKLMVCGDILFISKGL